MHFGKQSGTTYFIKLMKLYFKTLQQEVKSMVEKDLRKLSRTDLLELLLKQSRELDHCRAELEAANQKLADREIALSHAGSIAEASLLVNGFFEAAEQACDQYMENIRRLNIKQEAICESLERDTRLKCEKMEFETKAKCDQMVAEAQKQSQNYWEIVNQKVNQLLDSHTALKNVLRGQN